VPHKYEKPLAAWNAGNTSVRSLARALDVTESVAYRLMREMDKCGLIKMKREHDEVFVCCVFVSLCARVRAFRGESNSGVTHTNTIAKQEKGRKNSMATTRKRNNNSGIGLNMLIARSHQVATQLVSVQLSIANLLAIAVSATSVVAGTVTITIERYP